MKGKEVKEMKYVWLIIIDNHDSEHEYVVCSTKKAADRKFEEIIRDRYFHHTDELTEEKISEAVKNGFFESEYGDTIVALIRR